MLEKDLTIATLFKPGNTKGKLDLGYDVINKPTIALLHGSPVLLCESECAALWEAGGINA